MIEVLLRSGRFFLIILAELVPLFFIVTFISGLALEYISPETLRRSLSGRRGAMGHAIALVLGFVTPFCSCSTIPVGIMTTFLCSSPYPVEIALPILAPLFGVPSALVFIAAGGVWRCSAACSRSGSAGRARSRWTSSRRRYRTARPHKQELGRGGACLGGGSR